jgi:ABC-type uncharacterized transport system substrate-binding protein
MSRHPLDDALHTSEALQEPAFLAGVRRLWADTFTSQNENVGQEVLQAKRVEILKETIPSMRRLAVLANPNQPSTVEYMKAVNVATRSLGLQVEPLSVSSPKELDGAFAEISRRRADALLVVPDGMFWAVREDIVRLTAKARVPAMYWERAYADVGGLVSYAAA